MRPELSGPPELSGSPELCVRVQETWGISSLILTTACHPPEAWGSHQVCTQPGAHNMTVWPSADKYLPSTMPHLKNALAKVFNQFLKLGNFKCWAKPGPAHCYD